MGEFEKKLHELLHELPQRRNELEKLQQCYNAELLHTRELQAMVESGQSEVKTLRKQLSMVNRALYKSEEVLNASRDAEVKHRLSLVAANKTVDSIKDHSTKLLVENSKLKKRLEELERDVKSEAFFRESCSVTQSKTQATIESLITQMRNLEKDYRDVQRLAHNAIDQCNKGKLLLDHKDSTTIQLTAKVEELTLKINNLTTENTTLLKNMEKGRKNKPVEQQYVSEILQEWQSSMNETKARTAQYNKEVETLNQSLKNALDAQVKLQSQEAAANDKLKNLEVRLHEEKKKKERNARDCGVQTDLNISMDATCETTPLVQANIATQTDMDSFAQQQDKDNKQPPIITNNQWMTAMPSIDETESPNRATDYKQSSFPSVFDTKIRHQTPVVSQSLRDLMFTFKQQKAVRSTDDLSPDEIISQPNPSPS